VYVTGDIDTDAISRMNGNRPPRVEETEEDSSRLALPNHSE
jgi:amidophosphoribosyltransferase